MHILMLHQYLSTEGSGAESRFFEIGRRFIAQGHQVTVITTNARLGLSLGKKKIGLLQKNGLAVVAFNLDYNPRMNTRAKRRVFLAFARQAARQGRRLPRPDLLLASSPPLTVALPALSLSRRYRIPLVMEIRELWPDAVIQRGTLKGKITVSLARRLELKAYRRAAHLVATGPGIAAAIGDCGLERHKISVIPEELRGEALFTQYDAVINTIAGRTGRRRK